MADNGSKKPVYLALAGALVAGAIAGGLIIGLAQELSTLVISPAYKPAVAFALMVLILLWRPTGIFRS